MFYMGIRTWLRSDADLTSLFISSYTQNLPKVVRAGSFYGHLLIPPPKKKASNLKHVMYVYKCSLCILIMMIYYNM